MPERPRITEPTTIEEITIAWGRTVISTVSLPDGWLLGELQPQMVQSWDAVIQSLIRLRQHLDPNTLGQPLTPIIQSMQDSNIRRAMTQGLADLISAMVQAIDVRLRVKYSNQGSCKQIGNLDVEFFRHRASVELTRGDPAVPGVEFSVDATLVDDVKEQPEYNRPCTPVAASTPQPTEQPPREAPKGQQRSADFQFDVRVNVVGTLTLGATIPIVGPLGVEINFEVAKDFTYLQTVNSPCCQ